LPGDAIALAFRRPDRPSIGVSADSMCREEGGSRLGGTSLTGRWRGRHREVSKVLGQLCIEGYAIVSTDGMIADSRRRMVDELKVEADSQHFLARSSRPGRAWSPFPGRRCQCSAPPAIDPDPRRRRPCQTSNPAQCALPESRWNSLT